MILKVLRRPQGPPFLDRPAIEFLFGLRRRQAIELMHRFHGYQVGKTFLVDRTAVIGYLERRPTQDDVEHELARKRKVRDSLSGTGPIRIPVSATPLGRNLMALPPGIDLEPGRLTITFDQPIDLLQKLFELSQTLAHDFETLDQYAPRVGVRE